MIINFKALTFALVTFMLLFCETSQHYLSPDFSREDLINSQWKFLNGDGFLGDIKFEADGTITLYNNFNEKFWTFDGKVVTLLNGHRHPTARLHHQFRDGYGKWHVRGPFLHRNNWEHLIIQK
jgi:hypothetical protein